MTDIETTVIGAGVVGLACARSLALRGHDVVVLERHGLIGSETSSRNSEVIHAGIYYPQGSLKARLCVAGKAMLYDYCAANGVPYRRCGKLIVASSPDQVSELSNIARHAAANGVDDLVLLDRAGALAMEPQLACVAALHSPSTGIIDSHRLMQALEGELQAHGGSVILNSGIEAFEALPDRGFRLALQGSSETFTTRHLVLSAGHGTSALLAQAQTLAPPTYLAKGNYFSLAGRSPFTRLVYPVPEPGGLGVHLTIDLENKARFGPDVEWIEEIDYRVDAARAAGFYAAIRRYWPGLPDDSLEPDYCGIRPKLSRKGEPNADFGIHGPREHGREGLVALLGIESPGLTASLAIGGAVCEALGASPGRC